MVARRGNSSRQSGVGGERYAAATNTVDRDPISGIRSPGWLAAVGWPVSRVASCACTPKGTGNGVSVGCAAIIGP
jgi:hypothetical protein